MPKRAIIFLLAIATHAISCAQNVTTYNGDSEILGAAYSRVATKGDQVQSTLDYCAKNDSSYAARAVAVAAGWRQRNAKYVALAPMLKAEMHATAVRTGATAQWKIFDEKTFPAMKEMARTGLIGQLDTLPSVQRKEPCARVMAAVAEGKLDISADAQLVGYLNRRVAEQAKHKPK